MRSFLLGFCFSVVAAVLVATQPAAITAISGATLIDGNGGAAITDSVVLISGNSITAAGPRSSTGIPAGATIVNGTGKFIVPGLIDTNVHLSLYGGNGDRYETLAKYHPRQKEIVLEAAQLYAKRNAPEMLAEERPAPRGASPST